MMSDELFPRGGAADKVARTLAGPSGRLRRCSLRKLRFLRRILGADGDCIGKLAAGGQVARKKKCGNVRVWKWWDGGMRKWWNVSGARKAATGGDDA